MRETLRSWTDWDGAAYYLAVAFGLIDPARAPFQTKATSDRLELLTLPPWWTRAEAIGAIKKVRNALMHGNYEQAAIQSGR